jgi:cell division transport system permease protein
MAGRKMTSKQFAHSKRKRRQWITFVRMCRYGINNFSRNAWLTIAATAVMTITLLIVFVTLAARNTLVSSVDVIRDSVDMSIYVQTDIEDEAVKTISSDLKNLESVRGVNYISPEEARENFAEASSSDPDTLSALNEATNRNPGTFRVKLVDINDTSELRNFVSNNETYVQNMDPNREPSFEGERRTAIENIGRWVEFADRVGIIGSVVFIGISSLIIFNTIRMAIFNRRDEIEMMKLIGADKSFIRGPFIVEAVVYGFIAAIIATGLGVAGLYSLKDKLLSYQVAIEPTLDFVLMYILFVLLGMIILGALIGTISSLLATRRYLKI